MVSSNCGHRALHPSCTADIKLYFCNVDAPEQMPQFDPLYKKFFDHPEFFEDFVRLVLHQCRTFINNIDFTTAQKVPTELISESLHRRFIDRIWQCQSNDRKRVFIFLLEFQSQIDPDMGLRILNYSSMLMQALIADLRYRCGTDKHYPPILPLVLYNGKSKWTASMDAHSRFAEIEDGLDVCLPSQHYILVDEKRWIKSLTQERSLFTALVHIMHGKTPTQLIAAYKAVDQWLDDVEDRELKQTFIDFFIQTTKQTHPKLSKAIKEGMIMGEWRNPLAESMDRWAAEFKAEGLEEGLEEGTRNTLRHLLTRKFGELPAVIAERIETADRYQMERWAERVIEVNELEHIFSD